MAHHPQQKNKANNLTPTNQTTTLYPTTHTLSTHPLLCYFSVLCPVLCPVLSACPLPCLCLPPPLCPAHHHHPAPSLPRPRCPRLTNHPHIPIILLTNHHLSPTRAPFPPSLPSPFPTFTPFSPSSRRLWSSLRGFGRDWGARAESGSSRPSGIGVSRASVTAFSKRCRRSQLSIVHPCLPGDRESLRQCGDILTPYPLGFLLYGFWSPVQRSVPVHVKLLSSCAYAVTISRGLMRDSTQAFFSSNDLNSRAPASLLQAWQDATRLPGSSAPPCDLGTT